MTGIAALRLQAVSKRFGKTPALNGLDLTVPDGALVVLLGAAGAGKTTSLRIAAGLDDPDSGSVFIGGTDMAGREPKDRNVAMIFDNLALYPNRTGFENIAHPLRVRRASDAAITAKVHAVAATLRIPHVLGRLPRTMSGGERQRVALARALVRDPSVFLLDEPLSSLDAMLRVELRAELKRLQRGLGHALLFATPDFAEALAIADTIVMLDKGKVRQVAAPQDMYDAPADRHVARFIGAPEINLVPARVGERDAGSIRLWGAEYPVSPALSAALGRHRSPEFEAGLRPEHVGIGEAGAGARATVADIEPLGVKAALTLTTADGAARAVLPADTARRHAVGATVGLVPNLDRLVAFDRDSGNRFA